MQYVSFDTESTGVEPGSRMIELAAILFDDTGTIIDTFDRLVNPGMPIPEDAAKVNGITNEMLADKLSAGEVLRDFFDWLQKGNVMMAHYACFDTGIITWEAGRFGIPIPDGLMVIDTCEISKVMKETKKNALATLAEYHKLTRVGDAHRAFTDADLCRQFFLISNKRGIPESPLPWAQTGHNYSYTDELPEALAALPELVATAGALSFSYKDAKDAVTSRTITPYGWAMTTTGLMFHGMCHMRKERRTFKADRIL